MHNTESARLHASSLLARLGIVVADREASYPYELEATDTMKFGRQLQKFGRQMHSTYRHIPALETARKFNSGK